MPIDWRPFVERIRACERPLLTTHIRPDADGIGSMLALADALDGMGKDPRLAVIGVFPPRYRFLDPNGRIGRFSAGSDEFAEADLIVVLDTGTWSQLGEFADYLRNSSVQRIVIDHHVSQDDLGGLACIDTTAEATGRLVYEAITALGVPLSKFAANSLFAALAMDTGWFRHSNTVPRTFTLAATLVEHGADPTELYEQLFEQNSLPRLRLMGLVLDRLQTAFDGRVAYTEVLRSDYAATGAVPQDTEDLINLCRSLAGVEVAVFFMEQPAGGVKVSFRSRKYVDVAALAEQFGGGGHRRAAGAILPDPIAEAKRRVLDAVGNLLER